jgi:hypothetical protein
MQDISLYERIARDARKHIDNVSESLNLIGIINGIREDTLGAGVSVTSSASGKERVVISTELMNNRISDSPGFDSWEATVPISFEVLKGAVHGPVHLNLSNGSEQREISLQFSRGQLHGLQAFRDVQGYLNEGNTTSVLSAGIMMGQLMYLGRDDLSLEFYPGGEIKEAKEVTQVGTHPSFPGEPIISETIQRYSVDGLSHSLCAPAFEVRLQGAAIDQAFNIGLSSATLAPDFIGHTQYDVMGQTVTKEQWSQAREQLRSNIEHLMDTVPDLALVSRFDPEMKEQLSWDVYELLKEEEVSLNRQEVSDRIETTLDRAHSRNDDERSSSDQMKISGGIEV